jgi:hypothetical protein
MAAIKQATFPAAQLKVAAYTMPWPKSLSE